jgi:hypothetical protein
LIKALSDLKHLVVAPLSPQAHQLSSFEKDSNVEYLVDTQSISSQWKTKLKGQKPYVRVVRDLLIKKWVFVKRNKLRSAKPQCFSNLTPSPIVAQAPVLASCEEGYSRQRKDNIKFVMQGFKVAETGLSKKWIIRKKNRQLRDIIESALLFEALGLPRLSCLLVIPLAS